MCEEPNVQAVSSPVTVCNPSNTGHFFCFFDETLYFPNFIDHTFCRDYIFLLFACVFFIFLISNYFFQIGYRFRFVATSTGSTMTLKSYLE